MQARKMHGPHTRIYHSGRGAIVWPHAECLLYAFFGKRRVGECLGCILLYLHYVCISSVYSELYEHGCVLQLQKANSRIQCEGLTATAGRSHYQMSQTSIHARNMWACFGPQGLERQESLPFSIKPDQKVTVKFGMCQSCPLQSPRHMQQLHPGL